MIRQATIWAILFALMAGGWYYWANPPAPASQAERKLPDKATPTAAPRPTSTRTSPTSASRDLQRSDGDFDFYVLALSWSPTYCATDDDPNEFQCEGGRRHGFVVHGLWPQFERGYPQDCDTGGREDVPQRIRERLYPIMPSAGLIRYQWRKHGSCAGLSQADYFDVVQAAWRRVKVPAQFNAAAPERDVDPRDVERAFLDANADLPKDGVAVTCRDRHLEEVRICMTKGLEFRSCPEVDRRDCRARRVEMPAAR